MADIKTWLDKIDAVRFNPSAIQRLALSTLEETLSGKFDVVDPTNPFLFLMEASSVNAAAAMVQNEVLTRKLYPSMALTQEELYLHMSDADYVDRFAIPSRTSFTIILDKEELFSRVLDTGIGKTKKLTIPRHTEFTVAGISFTMQYPIDVKVMAHGGLQIVYDTSKPSPLQSLSTNVVDWTVVKLEGREFVKIDIPVSQFKITPQFAQLSLAKLFSKTFEFSDQFHFARAFYTLPDGSWKEMLTTHSDQVFDPLNPTILLKVDNNKLTVTVPQVYTTTRLLNTEIRVDIYTTRGPLDLILNNFPVNNFSVLWRDLEGDQDGKFVAPLTVFNTMSVFSDKVVSGGQNAITFEQLRDRIMSNAIGSPNLPITNIQLTTKLNSLGFDSVKDVDNITNRQFKATRSLPKPIDGSVVAGAASTMKTLTTSLEDLALLDTVKDNGNRLTILPDTLYQNQNGLISIVPKFQIDSLLSLPVDVRTRKINESRFLYSPFHYVLDMNKDRFESRAYYLDNPSIEAKGFVNENDTTNLQVATDSFFIERTKDGFNLVVTVKSGDIWKGLSDDVVFSQLSFIPVGEKDRAFINGTLVGLSSSGERIYSFNLTSNFDIDSNDNISLTSFSLYEIAPGKFSTPLETIFDITYSTNGISMVNVKESDIDNFLGDLLLPANTIGISHERLTTRFGRSLKGLWSASRSIVSSLDYVRYSADVPAIWENTVFVRDPVTGAIELSVDASNNIIYTVLHAKDDPVLDANGNPVIRFFKGDPILDANGDPVVNSSRKMVRQIDILMIDGAYWFATDTIAVGYKNTIPQTISDWVVNDIAKVSKDLLELTELFFFPKITLGEVSILVTEDNIITIPAEQTFSIEFFLNGTAFRDSELRTSLSKMAIETINEILSGPTVTMNNIISKITAKAGNDIVAVKVTGLGGDLNLTALTLQDDSVRLSIKKATFALPDGTVGVKDDVNFTFTLHEELL